MLRRQKFNARVKLILSAMLMIFVLSSCQFISNSYRYNNTTKEFVEDLLHKDYNKCMDLIFLDSIRARGINIDTFKSRLAYFGNEISNKFGNKLKYSLIRSEETVFSTDGEEKASTTKFYLQISNEKDYGVIYALYDDHSKKILDVKLSDEKEPIPDTTMFWLFGLLAICIPIFNIYVIIKVKRSTLKGKWLMYLAIILINVPSIAYSPINGLSFQLFCFQLFIGVGFSYLGYLGALWKFGIPLGGLFCLWRLHSKRAELEKQTEIINEPPIIEEESDETSSNQSID